ncbi:MAG: sensor histidine kinase, partial [Bradymonadaceae bacterium]
MFRRLRRDDHVHSVVCVVDDGDWKAANSAVRDGASDYLFVEQFDSPHLASHLRASVECGLAVQRRSVLQRELEERSSELLGLNALANGVSSSLDRDVITRRGLWVFAGVCQQTAVALLELHPLPELRNVGESDEETTPEVECVATFSARGLEEFCGEIAYDESWQNIVLENHTAVIEGRPEGDEFPGLEPFWDAHPDGRVTILPLHANQRPYGALVMADTDDHPADDKISREGMQAMALQFAGALENARLFEEIKDAYESLQETQDQLVHAEKFAAVGVLAAEIAHEINNPASFVISNLSVMVEYAETIAEYLDAVEELVDEETDGLIEELDGLQEEFEIGFLREDMEHLLSRSLSGMQRIHQVVQDLRYLSRDSGEEPGWVEIENLLDATVNLVRHEAKFRADIERDYDGAPQVMSDAGRLSQVFLNLVVNAVQAIES